MHGREKAGTFRDRNIVIVGLARSGTGAANLLAFLGAKVCVTDAKPFNSLKDYIGELDPYIKVAVGGHPAKLFNQADIIVVSPGVPLDIPPLMHARERGIPVIGELELAYQVIKSEFSPPRFAERGRGVQNSANPPLPPFVKGGNTLSPPLSKGDVGGFFIAVTGTNGKSTTTTLIDLMLKKAGFRTLLGGNIGNALTEELLKAISSEQLAVSKEQTANRYQLSASFIVAEVSSFQLESIKDFRPKIAVLLNITPDHLDRYHTMEEYINAKARVFENQGDGDYLILNADAPLIKKVKSEKLKVKSKKPKVLYFSREKVVEGVYYKNGMIYFYLPEFNILPSAFSLQPSTFRLKGVHNIENAMAASAAALVSGCPLDAVRDVLEDFPGLEHRLEFVCEIDGVSFFNDSKGTNIGAVVKSLGSFQNVILIMGGRDKAGDFTVLRDLISERVKALILLGEAREKIAAVLEGLTEMVFVNDIKEAVEASLSRASGGDVVLLSPGCASFDMFVDFEDRGRQFKKAVREIQKSKIKI